TTRPAKAVARRSSIADRSSARGCRITSTTPLRPLKATSAAANPTMIARLTRPAARIVVRPLHPEIHEAEGNGEAGDEPFRPIHAHPHLHRRPPQRDGRRTARGR